MKFWHRIFLGTLVIFAFAFNVGAWYLTSYSYNFNRNTETENSIREQGIILAPISDRIADAETFFLIAPWDRNRLLAIIRPLADFYRQQGVLLALYNEGKAEFSEIPVANSRLLDLPDEERKNIMEAPINGDRHVLIASKVPGYPHLTFVYARDISQIDDFRENVGMVILALNAAIFAFLGISIYLLLKRLTRPISDLTAITAEIAGGAYGKRASIVRRDEIGALGDSFNRMADSVEEHMARLTRSAEERQQFIDDLTHEMRTPLTSIIGYAEYLRNAKSTEDERIVASGHLHSMAIRMQNLSEKLMDLAFLRGESVDMKPVDVEALFGVLRISMSPLLQPRKVRLETGADIGEVFGDEELLLSMLANLVENAARASKEGSAVRVRAFDNKGAVIEVSDTGYGMEREEIGKIMAAFYRVDKSRSREFGGAGLGLSIVSRIAALHGAKLEIDSEPGAGTTVRIVFTTT